MPLRCLSIIRPCSLTFVYQLISFPNIFFRFVWLIRCSRASARAHTLFAERFVTSRPCSVHTQNKIEKRGEMIYFLLWWRSTQLIPHTSCNVDPLLLGTMCECSAAFLSSYDAVASTVHSEWLTRVVGTVGPQCVSKHEEENAFHCSARISHRVASMTTTVIACMYRFQIHSLMLFVVETLSVRLPSTHRVFRCALRT